VAKLLELGNPTPETEDIFKYLMFAVYSGGFDTTNSTISTFFLAMTIYPDVQRKAQAELDAVLGPRCDRLPDFSDRPNLPYIEALVKEVFRWHPAVPMYVHRLMQDDEYEGYHIPEGSFIFHNTWGLMRDEAVYPDPLAFNPDRFLSKHDDDSVNPDSRIFLFGSGRRVCPGMNLASDSLFLLYARTLAAFNISEPIGDDGRPVRQKAEFTSGLISHPTEFMCEITPRSAEIAKLVSTFEEE